VDEGLVFWLIIVAVAVLQGIGRKKRKAGQPGQKPPSLPQTRSAPPQAQERVTASSRPTQVSSRPEEDDGGDESSEGMIPQDVWAEILGLARGDPRRDEPEASPQPEAPLPESGEDRSREESPREERPAASVLHRETRASPAPRPFPTSHGANAALHQTRPENFESRLALPRPPPPESQRGGARDVRAGLFGDGSPRELRKAIILKEVLGAPLGLREEGG